MEAPFRPRVPGVELAYRWVPGRPCARPGSGSRTRRVVLDNRSPPRQSSPPPIDHDALRNPAWPEIEKCLGDQQTQRRVDYQLFSAVPTVGAVLTVRVAEHWKS